MYVSLVVGHGYVCSLMASTMPTLQERCPTLRRHTVTTSLTFRPPDLAAGRLLHVCTHMSGMAVAGDVGLRQPDHFQPMNKGSAKFST